MEPQQPASIGRLAVKYGLIQGALAFVLFLVVTLSGMKQNWVSSVINIAVLIVLMVLAHREFKKTHEGIMTYGQGVGSGTLLSVVASVLTCILLYIYVGFINTGYSAAALQAQRVVLEQRGLAGAQLDQALAFTGAMLTPTGIVVTALISGVIVGVLVALIVSIFTRDSDPRAVI
jgi:uncharacterized membrane protein (DUF485 family)